MITRKFLTETVLFKHDVIFEIIIYLSLNDAFEELGKGVSERNGSVV